MNDYGPPGRLEPEEAFLDDPEPCLLDHYGLCLDDAVYDGLCEFHYEMSKDGYLRGLDDCYENR